MAVYVVRKRGAQWSVCASDGALVTFDDYTEAVEVARLAAGVMADARLAIPCKPDRRCADAECR